MKKYHRYYVKFRIINNNFKDIPSIAEKFKKDTGYNIMLTNHEISEIKTKYNNKYKKINFFELKNYIKDDNNNNINIDIKSFDIKYEYKYNKNNAEKTEIREDKIIVFGTNESILNLDSKNNKEFFIDTTFKIIPKKFKPYKMMTISSKDKNNDSVIACFIFYKFQDKISYERIFRFLKDNYNFIPTIIHHDYEIALYSSFDNNKIFDEPITHVFCHFHYLKAIVDKMIQLKLTKRKLNKKSYMIIKNIQILSFIKQKNLKKYTDFIINKLLSLNVDSKFISYIRNNWFNRNPDLFNYEKLFTLIDNVNNNKNKEIILNKFFFTNNISEALHRKINNYLPKNLITAENFASTLKKVFINNIIKHGSLKRKDFKSRAIIKIIEDLNLSDSPKWIDNSKFREYGLKIIKENNNQFNEEDIYNYFNYRNPRSNLRKFFRKKNQNF